MNYADRVVLFRDRIGQVITRSQLNPSKFAASIGVDRSTLSQLLSDKNLRLPRADTIASIAEKYSVSIDWLLGLTEEGPVDTKLVAGPLEIEEYRDTGFNKRFLRWHREAQDYKVRYIPSTLPDLLKISAVTSYEFRRYGTGKTDQIVTESRLLLAQLRQNKGELEAVQSLQVLEGFARGEGVWSDLPAKMRKKQLEHAVELIEEIYPRFRWFMFDEREFYTVPFTIFGPIRAVVFLGQHYLVLNSAENIRLLSKRFNELIRNAVVHPHEVKTTLENLIKEI